MPNDRIKLKRLMFAANHLRKTKPVILRGATLDPSNALKYAWWFESFRDNLRAAVYRFSYFKKDGHIREARGTLNPAFIPAEHMPKSGMDPEALAPQDTFRYYDIDAGGWRSFRLDNFIGFVELVPVENVIHHIDDQDLIDECSERGYIVRDV